MAGWTREMPWRQGSIIAVADLQALGVQLPADCAGGLVITHDCDLANSVDTEPRLEFLPFERLRTANGNNTNAKNPRLLHLEIQQDGETFWIQLRAREKRVLEKNELAAFEPAVSSLSDKERQVMQGWLAARYRRHAFPDELVERMRPVSSYLEKQLKKRAQEILGVWVDYQPREAVVGDEPCELWLYIIYSTDSPVYRSEAEALAAGLKDKFSGPLPGLILAECEAVSEDGFTLADQRSTVEFKLEHLSHRIYPDGVVIE